jgi:phage terminase small subunit
MTELVPSLQNKLSNSSEIIARNRESDWPDLDSQRKAFAYFFLEDYNARNAAEKAGFNKNTGSKLLREPLLMAFVNDCQKTLGERSFVNRDFVTMKWLEMLPKVMGEEEIPIINNKDSYAFMAKQFDSAGAAKVLTELSKSTDFYANGSGSTASVTVNIDLGALGMSQEKIVNG